MQVAVVKYNAGNIYSVLNALRRLGVEPLLTDDPTELRRADRVLFPGQGEARGAMEYLRARGLDEVIRSLTQPVLGICIGQQLMCRHSEEGDVDCLGIFDVDVKRFQPVRHEDKVPCMGWNALYDLKSPLFDGLDNGQRSMVNGQRSMVNGQRSMVNGQRSMVNGQRSMVNGQRSMVNGQSPYVYFVHSYYVPLCEETIATADYIQPYSAALHKDNFFATQFHPEKSGSVGERIIKNFLFSAPQPPRSALPLGSSKNLGGYIELIPAIDIIDGQCVRLTKGDYDQKTVYGNPLEMAREFERLGYRRLHVVDLDGAKSRHIVNEETLRAITTETNLVVDFGGGLKTDDDIGRAFEAGASMVTVGSVAVTQPELFGRWLRKYGPERIILGADVRQGRISINGWKEDSSEELLPFLRKYVDMGVTNVLCTEISKDGTLSGPAISLYKKVMEAYPTLHLIASGGVSSEADIQALRQAGIPAVVFGKAIYEGRIDLAELIKTVTSDNH